MQGSATDYFRALERHLRLGPAEESDLVRELRDHLEDRIAALMRGGATAEQARARALAGFGRPETFAHLIRQARFVVRWREALFAAVPAEALAALLLFGVWRQPVVAVAFAATVIAVTVYGLWGGRPAWFYPWAGVALTFPFVAGYFAFEVLGKQGGRVVDGTAGIASLAGFAGAVVYFPLGLLVVTTALLVALRRDWLDASILLTPIPAALAWLVDLHDRGGVFARDPGAGSNPVIAFVYLSLGIATVAFLRAQTRTQRLATLVTAAVVVLSAASIANAEFALAAVAARSLLLVGFLLSPALVTRRR